jgi:4-diphosphocytidyl-2-C-methyl-D-erythritol kinase
VKRVAAPAKINLALVVGPLRADGKHEVATVLQRIDLADRVRSEPAPRLEVTGFAADTLVTSAARSLAEAAGVEPRWRFHVDKRIPVAGGLGGGSSDAAAALRLANETLAHPLPRERLHRLAMQIGADVPFFLESGPQLGIADGAQLSPLSLPQDFWIVLCLPHGERKPSTGAVYAAFDARSGEQGFEERRAALHDALAAGDLGALPPNDLASSPVSNELRALGAWRADMSGAGPTVYGLFRDRARARGAARALARRGRTWLTAPAWYG